MATLQVTNLQNTAATVTNVSLLADGSTTIVLNATGTNRTGGLRYNAGNLEVYTSGGVWVAAGGGTGTVTGVTGALPITVATGTTTPVIAINAATNAAAGAIEIATLAEAATGTDATRALTPESGVPKDASGMTGAALLPGGTGAQQPATPVAGMIRYNTNTYGADTVYEAYDNVTSSWRPIQYGTSLGVLPNYTATNGAVLPASGTYENITIPAGVTVTVSGLSKLTARTSIVIEGTINGAGAGVSGGVGSINVVLNTPQQINITGNSGSGAGAGGNLGGIVSGTSYGFALLTSSSGGSGQMTVADNTGTTYSQGGNGGGSLVLISQGTLTVGAAAVINMSGGAAPAAVAATVAKTGGGGGGSGGLVLLQSTGAMTLGAAALNVSGGAGGSGATSGFGTQGAYGGGGGGGGYVVLNSPSLTDSSIKTLTGGAAGATAGTTVQYTGGGAGGGFGGNGGKGGANPATVPTAGSAGQFLTNAYI